MKQNYFNHDECEKKQVEQQLYIETLKKVLKDERQRSADYREKINIFVDNAWTLCQKALKALELKKFDLVILSLVEIANAFSPTGTVRTWIAEQKKKVDKT